MQEIAQTNSTAKKWRVAVVVQRYGEEVSGGAELHARWLAERLLCMAHVEVITTCAVDYYTWDDYYTPGESMLNGVRVHRFPVDAPRHWNKFRKLTGQVLNGDPSLIDQLQWIRQQGPISTPLFSYVDQAYERFDAFIFFTYLYATTFFGLPLVSNRALLVPTAHEEPYLELPIFRPVFHLPHTIVYNTTTEKRLVNRITRNGHRDHDVVAGIGINVPESASASRFRQKFDLQGAFALYVGRIDQSKNVPQLLSDFSRYLHETERDVTLVLIGKGNAEIPAHPRIRALGFLSEQDKFDAIEAATLVIVPSRYESLSMITLEAWMMKRPVLVNGQCAVLKDLCRASNGGLYYHSFDEFKVALTLLLDDPELRERLGKQGWQHATRHYDWAVILEKYRQVFHRLAPL
ncbi:MAG: glycosyltransferase family 4 protein [Chloroflexota bacterium]